MNSGETKIGTTYGLARYTDEQELWAEQVYVNLIDEPVVVPHPDRLDPRFPVSLPLRTVRIRKGRGYSFPAVLDLTEQQAVEMAKLILDHFGDTEYIHPGRRWDANVIRSKGKNIQKALDEIANDLEAMG
jgi:hypothetical protein